MKDTLLHIIALSISASVLIGLVAGIRRLPGEKVSHAWYYYIWLPVTIRLLIPFSFYGGVTGRLYDAARDIPAGMYMADNGISERMAGSGGTGTVTEAGNKDAGAVLQTANQAAGNRGEEASLTAGTTEEALRASFRLPSLEGRRASVLLWIVWLLPAAVLFIRRLGSLNRFLRRLKKERKPVESAALLETNRRLSQEMGIRKPLPLYRSTLAVSPMLTGFFCPFLVFPEDYVGEDRDTADYILRHELVHYKRKDLAYKWLVQAAVCLHWFNPAVRFMAGKIEGDCELSCDEAVLLRLTPSQRMTYGDVLLSSLRSGKKKKIAASVSLCEDAGLVKERLYAIMRFGERKKKTVAEALTIIVMTAVFLSGGITSLAKGRSSDVKGVSPAAGAEVFTGGRTDESYAHKPAVWGTHAEQVPWEGRFTCSSYFNNQYYVQLAWNNAPSNYGTVRTVDTGTGIYEVSFYEGTEALADNADFMKALKATLREQKQRESTGESFWKQNNRLVQPVVFFVQGPYQESAGELAVQAYEDGDMGFFSVMIGKADTKTQEALIEKAYQNADYVGFSIGIGSLSAEKQKAYAEQAYENDEINFFSITVGLLSEEDLKELLARAKREGRMEYYYIMGNN